MKKFVFAAIVVVVSMQAAVAHSKKERTVPDDGATVAATNTIEMQFDDPMRVTAISLTGPDGEVDITRQTGFEPVMHFVAAVPPGMRTGKYKVEWRGLAADGHPMQGAFGFSVAD